MKDNFPKISSDVIELDVTLGMPVTIAHGFGRQIAGWLIVWRTADVGFYLVDSEADSSQNLVLMPTASGFVRLVLL